MECKQYVNYFALRLNLLVIFVKIGYSKRVEVLQYN